MKPKTIKLSGFTKFMLSAALTLVFVLMQELVPMAICAYAMGHFYFEIVE